MKLLRLKADGFGCLRDEYHFDPGRLTLLVDENERGKSTLLAAVAAALYGLEGDRRSHRVLTPLERWKPWDGGSYQVELELELEGARYTITRNFDRATVEVWNDRGQDLTAEFREGRDEFPVGKKLLGLDADEFEKCAFLRQGELDQVVPDEERERRVSTLHARLESAADTRVGDTNATEALRVLDEAASSYTCAELETTLKVETALQRLGMKREVLQSEIKTLEHDLGALARPLEELTRLSEEEAGARAEVGRLEAARRAARAEELRSQLRLDDARHAELRSLQDEVAALADLPQVPPAAESSLGAVVGRFGEAERNLEALRARRRETDDERERLLNEVQGLQLYASFSPQDADRLAARAEEIRRIERERDTLHAQFEASREAMAAQGYELGRVDLLAARFGQLAPEDQELLRDHSRSALGFQTEAATQEKVRTESIEALRELDRSRHRRRVPGWLVLALGLGGALAAGVAELFDPRLPWLLMLAGAGLLALGGATLLLLAARAGRGPREEAQQRKAAAEEQLRRIRLQRLEQQRRLDALAERLNYTQLEGLLREWNDYGRLVEERLPVNHTQQQIAALERRRQQLFDEARTLLERAGGGPADPAYLELAAEGIRHLHAAQERLGQFDKSWSWLDEALRQAGAKVAEITSEAAGILESAGLLYNPERPLPEHLDDLAACSQSAARLSLLVDTLIPRASSVLLAPSDREHLQSQLALLEAGGEPAPGVAAAPGSGAPEASATPAKRATPDYEGNLRVLRAAIDASVARRNELRMQFEHGWRRCHETLAARRAELETIERAHHRAARFKAAVDLARGAIQRASVDTHRRWAEFLNQRVAAILGRLGSDLRQLRFGEDLDFSVRLATGQQVARGKALLQLSAGARDQLHFAVRVAISEYLSQGRSPLPLLVDDCFANSDDPRTRAGMKALIELSSAHQVVFVTCHRQRQQALAGLDPELYAERVQWLETRASRTRD